jgi:8-oxo-dGTP pyrophosphatase MutT (NUDIX family)
MRIDIQVLRHHQVRVRTRDDGESATAAHIIFRSQAGKVLLLRRTGQDYGGHWGMPGGTIEPSETPLLALVRELNEEVGVNLKQIPNAINRCTALNVSQGSQAYVLECSNEFVPVLNDEHDAHCWASPSDLPAPMHPNALAIIKRFTSNS